MNNRKYLVLTKETCTFNKETGHWTIDLPRDFVNGSRLKHITVLNFMYYGCFVLDDSDPKECALQSMVQLDYTSFHCPTLIDGNFHQEDYYIATLCYNYNTVNKVYPIRSHCEKLEFWFKNTSKQTVTDFEVKYPQHGFDDRKNQKYEERFTIELELVY